MSQQYPQVTVTPVVHGRAVPDATPVTMVEAQFTPRSRRYTFERHHICTVCNFCFEESAMVELNGKWYCTRYKHDQEGIADEG